MLRFTQKTAPRPGVATTLTLPWSLRVKSRQRVRLDNGEEAGLFLERGIILRDGDCLLAENNSIVQVKAADETVSTIHCKTPLQLAQICYHLGNRHVDLEIREHRIRYPHDHVLDYMLKGMGFTVKVEQAPFEPETGAYSAGHGHHHEAK